MEDKQLRDGMRTNITEILDRLARLLADLNKLDGIETKCF